MKTIVVRWREDSYHCATVNVPDDFDLADQDALQQATHGATGETWQSGIAFEFHATPMDFDEHADGYTPVAVQAPVHRDTVDSWNEQELWAAWNQGGGIEDWVDGALPGRLNAVTISAIRAFELFKTAVRAWETGTGGRFVLDSEEFRFVTDTSEDEFEEFVANYYAPEIEQLIEAVPVETLSTGDRIVRPDADGLWTSQTITAITPSDDHCVLQVTEYPGNYDPGTVWTFRGVPIYRYKRDR